MQNIPSTKEISDQIVADFESKFGSDTPILSIAVLTVIAKIMGGMVALLYKLTGWGILQQFVSTASFQPVQINGQTVRPLVELGSLVLQNYEPKPSQNAIIEINIELFTSSADIIPSGSQLIGQANQWVYALIDDVDLNQASPISAQIKAVKDPNASPDSDQSFGGGSGGNLENGSLLTFVNPLINVQPVASVQSSVQLGVDSEDELSYRTRVREGFRTVPQGGAIVDYRLWGIEVTGVFQIYPYTGLFIVSGAVDKTWGASVDVYVQTTPDIDPDGIPPQSLLNDVKEYIDQFKPAGTYVNPLPIIRTVYDIEIIGFQSNDPVSTKQDIENAIDKYLASIKPFIQGVDTIQQDTVSVAAISQQVFVITQANNSSFDTLTVKTNGSDIGGQVQMQAGELCKLGAITYI